MKKNLLKYGIYFLYCIFCYFGIIPFSMQNGQMSFVLILVILPLLLLLGSAAWAYFYSFDLIPPIMAGLLFLFPVYLFMNDSALIYVLAYAIIALAGSGIGYFLKKIIKR